MFKILRYLVLAGVVIIGLSVVRGVGGAFKEEKMTSLPGLESPPEFMRNLTSGAAGVVSGAVLGVANGISKNVSDTIERKATDEVTKNFNNLGEKEKEILKRAICE